MLTRAVLVALLTLGIAGAAWAQATPNGQATQPPAADQTKQTGAPAPPLPVRIEGSVRLEREKEVEPDWDKLKCGEAKSHDEADLCEQRRMAAAAERTVTLGWWQVGLSAAGFLALLYTLRLSRRATNAAVAANAITERNIFEVQAPFLYPEIISTTIEREFGSFVIQDNPISPHTPINPTIYYQIRNYGEGPAIFQAIRGIARCLKEFPQPIPDLGNRTNPVHPIIEPGEAVPPPEITGEPSHYRIMVNPALTAADVQAVRGGVDMRIFFLGEVQFSAPNGADYVQTFGFWYHPSLRKFIPMGAQHNQRTRRAPETQPSKHWWQFWK